MTAELHRPVFATAAVTYFGAGWPAVLPVPAAAKFPPPVGYTGEAGADTDMATLHTWAENGYAAHSVALRMPEGVIGIDVDHYVKGDTVKAGADTLAAAEASWGPLPVTWCSTARGDEHGPGLSAIRFFRTQPGRYATTLGPAIEIIQRHHRYAVVAPSHHHDIDADYRWYRPEGTPAEPGQVPRPEDLPWLPTTWVEGLRSGASSAGPIAADLGSGERLLAALAQDYRDPCSEMHDALAQAGIQLTAAEAGARHDTMTARVRRVIALGGDGHPGTGMVLEALSTQWDELTVGENRDDEFRRMCVTAARKTVTEIGGRIEPSGADPCLLFGGFTVTGPAPLDDRGEAGTPLPGLMTAPVAYSWRHVIGTAPFDPQADLDQTIATEVLTRTWAMIRHATPTKTAWIQRGPVQWELHGDLTRRAVAEVASLMPVGDPEPIVKGMPATPEQRQAKRRARMHTNASASAVAATMRALTLGGYHPSAVALADLDAEPEVFWAGGMPYDLRASTDGPAFAAVDPNTPHLCSAAVMPELRPTPGWDAFLARVWPDPAVRAWALRVLAITLTGHPDAALPILLGPGGSGKSSTIELIMSLLGSYAHAANPKLLSGESSHDSIVFALKGRRLSFIDEGPRDGRWAQERLKQLTGGTTLTGNAMNQDPISFRPTHTLVLTANREPLLTDEAVRRRVRLIPCEGDPAAVREARQGLHPRAWAAEAPGVLAALMAEAAAWLAEPDSALTSAAPAAISSRAEEIAVEQDVVALWLEEACEPWPAGTPSGRLYENFVAWCRNNAIKAFPASKEWGPKLDVAGFPVRRNAHVRLRDLRVKPDYSPGDFPFIPTPRGDGSPQGDDGPMTGPVGTAVTPYNPRSTSVFSPSMTGVTGQPPMRSNNKEEDKDIVNSVGHMEHYDANIWSGGSFGAHSSLGGEKTTSDLRKQGVTPPVTGPTDPSPSDLFPVGDSETPKPTPSSRNVSKRDAAARADQDKITKAEARKRVAEEKRRGAVAEASGPRHDLPAVVDRAGTVTPIDVELAAAVIAAATTRTGALTVDVETSGYPVGHKHYRLRSVQLGDAGGAVVLDPTDEPQRAVISAALHGAPVLHAHSATADLVPLAHAGLIDPERAWAVMHDTVIPAKLADPSSTGSDPGLKQLASAVLGDHATAPGAEAARSAVFKAGKWLTNVETTTPIERSGWAQIDTRSEVMLRYAASDVLDTAALAQTLPAPDPAVAARERFAQAMTARVTHRGLRLDPEQIAMLSATHQGGLARARAAVRRWGIENPGSNPQVGAKATELGATLPRTATGKPSVTAAVLEGLREAGGELGELMSAVLDYRHHETVLGLFLAPYAELVEHGDGRVRPTIYTIGTNTGRMCLPTDHGLVTPAGYVKAEDVREGMLTLDADGRWVRVLAVHRYDDAPIETLTNRGIELAGTPEHRWVTTREHEAAYAARNGRPAPARELRRLSDHPRLRVHLAPDVEPFDFDARTIPADTDGQCFAALVGMLVTDGRCVDSDEPEVGLRAHVYQTEAKFHAEFRRVIPEAAVMYDRVTRNGEAHHEIRIAARWLRSRLDAAGLRAGAKLKESPDLHAWVAGLPLDEVRAFFAACWLADGSLERGDLACGSGNLRAVLTLAAYRLGVVAYTYESPPSEWSNGPRTTLSFRRPVITVRKSVHGIGSSAVWCVTTGTGTFTAVGPRGTVYLTGNSAVRPNLQQLPRTGGVRACITADEEHVLVSADFSSVELRVAAALSGDPTLRAFITEGRDLHAEIARQVWGADAGKAQRYIAKRIVFGRLYGGGLSTLAAQAGQPHQVVQSAIDALDRLTPGLAAWSRQMSAAAQRGQTQFRAYSGRVIHLPGDRPHAAANYGIQGTARELLVDALHRWADTRWGTATLVPVHDELVVMVPESDGEQATAELERAMTTEINGIPITAESDPPSFFWTDSA